MVRSGAPELGPLYHDTPLTRIFNIGKQCAVLPSHPMAHTSTTPTNPLSPPPTDVYKELMAPRKRILFDPSLETFRLSRSKIDLGLKCERCFYLDRRLGIGQPSSPPFSLNSAVDELLKREFDICREAQKPHPLMKEIGLDAVPFKHKDMEEWRDALRRGITYALPKTNLVITGGIDDVWINPKGELYIVDYKATSKNGEVSLDAEWQIAYKRQVEIYQWLFKQNGFNVNDTAFFVYCNGDKDRPSFDARLDFSIKVLPYEGKTTWIEPALRHLHEVLSSPHMPEANTLCEHCQYRAKAAAVERWAPTNEIA